MGREIQVGDDGFSVEGYCETNLLYAVLPAMDELEEATLMRVSLVKYVHATTVEDLRPFFSDDMVTRAVAHTVLLWQMSQKLEENAVRHRYAANEERG